MEGVNVQRLFQDLRLDPNHEEHRVEIIREIASLRASGEEQDAKRFERHYGLEVEVNVKVKEPVKVKAKTSKKKSQ